MKMELIKEFVQKSKPYFQEYKRLKANCLKCNSQMILKFASNPQKHKGSLSIILCCSNNCDKEIWNTDANEKKFTRWWLDGSRNREVYEKIINSLPDEENELIKRLENELKIINLQ